MTEAVRGLSKLARSGNSATRTYGTGGSANTGARRASGASDASGGTRLPGHSQDADTNP
jgi:hypothetical protein